MHINIPAKLDIYLALWKYSDIVISLIKFLPDNYYSIENVILLQLVIYK